MSDKLKYRSNAIKEQKSTKLDMARIQFAIEALDEGKPIRHVAVVACMSIEEVKELASVYCCQHKERNEKIFVAAKKGKRYNDVAQEYHISVTMVSYICRQRGLRYHQKYLYFNQVKELIQQGVPDKRIGIQFGLSHTAIRTRRLKLCINKPPYRNNKVRF